MFRYDTGSSIFNILVSKVCACSLVLAAWRLQIALAAWRLQPGACRLQGYRGLTQGSPPPNCFRLYFRRWLRRALLFLRDHSRSPGTTIRGSEWGPASALASSQVTVGGTGGCLAGQPLGTNVLNRKRGPGKPVGVDDGLGGGPRARASRHNLPRRAKLAAAGFACAPCVLARCIPISAPVWLNIGSCDALVRAAVQSLRGVWNALQPCARKAAELHAF